MASKQSPVYSPGRGERYTTLMKKAIRTNQYRDIRTAISAIACGIEIYETEPGDSWDCVAEGLEMIQQAERRIRLI